MNIFTEFIDILYPPRCHICGRFLKKRGRDISHFCNDCLIDFPEKKAPLCPLCGIQFESMNEENHLCENCLRKRPAYDALGAPYHYAGGIMEAIHQLKYDGKTQLARSLGGLLASFAMDWLDETGELLTMPVPLHPRKLRERGFNQSLLLSKAVSLALNMDLDFLSLRRVRYTRPQTGLNSKERRKNVRKAFEVFAPGALKGKTVVLVDDVATTGSTLNECGRVLKKAGCDKVLCLVLARTSGY